MDIQPQDGSLTLDGPAECVPFRLTGGRPRTKELMQWTSGIAEGDACTGSRTTRP
jgi:hypothetical protein